MFPGVCTHRPLCSIVDSPAGRSCCRQRCSHVVPSRDSQHRDERQHNVGHGCDTRDEVLVLSRAVGWLATRESFRPYLDSFVSSVRYVSFVGRHFAFRPALAIGVTSYVRRNASKAPTLFLPILRLTASSSRCAKIFLSEVRRQLPSPRTPANRQSKGRCLRSCGNCYVRGRLRCADWRCCTQTDAK